ncbi:MAG: hypothetical protein M3072_06545 [Candidatus Dormibacteraeota bacterium]|nr:hypothetical protein [Candidatus Dormibacteraeota bacterium]
MASEAELKQVLTRLRRDARKAERLSAELERSREHLAAAEAQLLELRAAEAQVRQSAGDLREGLEEVLAVEHGKRQDRRLSRAQRLAGRALARADKPAARGRRGQRKRPRADPSQLKTG